MTMKEQITIISDDLNHGIITEKEARTKLLILLGVTTRTFRFSGINKNVKFVVNVRANDRETAIAYFETEHPKLNWRTTTEITEVT